MEYNIKGQYDGTVDEKGRLLLPGKIKASLPDDILIQTRSVDKCIWLFPKEPWDNLESKIMENSSLMKSQSRLLHRTLIAPAHEIIVEKTGRIKLSASIMKSVGVERECVILGLGDHIEIWDTKTYEQYQFDSEEELNEALEGIDF